MFIGEEVLCFEEEEEENLPDRGERRGIAEWGERAVFEGEKERERA